MFPECSTITDLSTDSNLNIVFLFKKGGKWIVLNQPNMCSSLTVHRLVSPLRVNFLMDKSITRIYLTLHKLLTT